LGLLNFATDVSVLFTSTTSGLHWQHIGFASIFLTGAGFAALAILLVVATQKLLLLK
jgi:hypothetical protein